MSESKAHAEEVHAVAFERVGEPVGHIPPWLMAGLDAAPAPRALTRSTPSGLAGRSSPGVPRVTFSYVARRADAALEEVAPAATVAGDSR